jgi:predicted alpha/beta-fold hydrolase
MDYIRPGWLFNKHLETVYPAVFRKVVLPQPKRERIITPDQDFLDLDWFVNRSNRLIIISHGLEGNSKRGYVLGMAKAFIASGYDVLAWNFRGCSEELNLRPRFYHSGATDDLDTVVQHVQKSARYQSVNLIGFSLGGNLTLKYLGEDFDSAKSIDKGVAISVPLNLDTSCQEISKRENWLYELRFLRSLKSKVSKKAKYITLPSIEKIKSINKLRDFDDLITGPLHGFKDAVDYYSRCSSINFLEKIRTPTLIINALNDPFLSADCYPESANKNLTLKYPEHGGHVGFTLFNEKNLYWSEIQALQFIAEIEI